jgi:hypothetical protein
MGYEEIQNQIAKWHQNLTRGHDSADAADIQCLQGQCNRLDPSVRRLSIHDKKKN